MYSLEVYSGSWKTTHMGQGLIVHTISHTIFECIQVRNENDGREGGPEEHGWYQEMRLLEQPWLSSFDCDYY